MLNRNVNCFFHVRTSHYAPHHQRWSTKRTLGILPKDCPTVSLSVCTSVNYNLACNLWSIHGTVFIFGIHIHLFQRAKHFQMAPTMNTLWLSPLKTPHGALLLSVSTPSLCCIFSFFVVVSIFFLIMWLYFFFILRKMSLWHLFLASFLFQFWCLLPTLLFFCRHLLNPF